MRPFIPSQMKGRSASRVGTAGITTDRFGSETGKGGTAVFADSAGPIGIAADFYFGSKHMRPISELFVAGTLSLLSYKFFQKGL